MQISVSSLGFCTHIYQMCRLERDIGVEIFYEWGGATYWALALAEILRGRTGGFSIHAPFQGDILEMSLTNREDAMFDYLQEPFELYHKYGGGFYVVHINAPYATEPTSEEKRERIKRVEERLARFNDICVREGVNMLVENLAFGGGKKTLFDQAEFLRLFERNPDLRCLIDTGHALLGGLDIFEVQKALKGRIKAYHVHDNNGVMDEHQRVLTGRIDWNRFGEGVRLYTPDATLVMEYDASAVSSVEAYMQDAAALRALCAVRE